MLDDFVDLHVQDNVYRVENCIYAMLVLNFGFITLNLEKGICVFFLINATILNDEDSLLLFLYYCMTTDTSLSLKTQSNIDFLM